MPCAAGATGRAEAALAASPRHRHGGRLYIERSWLQVGCICLADHARKKTSAGYAVDWAQALDLECPRGRALLLSLRRLIRLPGYIAGIHGVPGREEGDEVDSRLGARRISSVLSAPAIPAASSSSTTAKCPASPACSASRGRATRSRLRRWERKKPHRDRCRKMLGLAEASRCTRPLYGGKSAAMVAESQSVDFAGHYSSPWRRWLRRFNDGEAASSTARRASKMPDGLMAAGSGDDQAVCLAGG